MQEHFFRRFNKSLLHTKGDYYYILFKKYLDSDDDIMLVKVNSINDSFGFDLNQTVYYKNDIESLNLLTSNNTYTINFYEPVVFDSQQALLNCQNISLFNYNDMSICGDLVFNCTHESTDSIVINTENYVLMRRIEEVQRVCGNSFAVVLKSVSDSIVFDLSMTIPVHIASGLRYSIRLKSLNNDWSDYVDSSLTSSNIYYLYHFNTPVNALSVAPIDSIIQVDLFIYKIIGTARCMYYRKSFLTRYNEMFFRLRHNISPCDASNNAVIEFLRDSSCFSSLPKINDVFDFPFYFLLDYVYHFRIYNKTRYSLNNTGLSFLNEITDRYYINNIPYFEISDAFVTENAMFVSLNIRRATHCTIRIIDTNNNTVFLDDFVVPYEFYSTIYFNNNLSFQLNTYLIEVSIRDSNGCTRTCVRPIDKISFVSQLVFSRDIGCCNLGFTVTVNKSGDNSNRFFSYNLQIHRNSNSISSYVDYTNSNSVSLSQNFTFNNQLTSCFSPNSGVSTSMTLVSTTHVSENEVIYEYDLCNPDIEGTYSASVQVSYLSNMIYSSVITTLNELPIIINDNHHKMKVRLLYSPNEDSVIVYLYCDSINSGNQIEIRGSVLHYNHQSNSTTYLNDIESFDYYGYFVITNYSSYSSRTFIFDLRRILIFGEHNINYYCKNHICLTIPF